MESKIGVVIVTYNRLDKLKIALEKFEDQTKKPSYLLVVNNASNDGTSEYLNEWKKIKSQYNKFVLNLEENTGGSGGFYNGLKEALKLDANWIWVSDDDAYPKEDAIENAMIFLNKYKNKEELSAFCAKVINNGRIDYFHRKRVKYNFITIKTFPTKENDYENDFFEIDRFSYVGAILNKEILNKAGITNKDYFIYYDDTEHAYRMNKYGKILVVPSIVVEHNVKNGNTQDWKIYYYIRNKLVYYKTIAKRYYYLELIKIEFKQFIKKILHYKIYNYKLINEAIKDAKNNKLGKSEIYYPGWTFEKNTK